MDYMGQQMSEMSGGDEGDGELLPVRQKTWKRSEAINELAAALAKAQGAMKGAAKSSSNPHFASRYADLSSVWDACRDQLSINGLAVVQIPDYCDWEVTVITLLLHASGQYIESALAARPDKNTPQGIGSTITYLRRYALAAMVGVAPEDDDGEAATSHDNSSRQGPQSYRGKPAPSDSEKPRPTTETLEQALKDISVAKDEEELVAIWARLAKIFPPAAKSARSKIAEAGAARRLELKGGPKPEASPPPPEEKQSTGAPPSEPTPPPKEREPGEEG